MFLLLTCSQALAVADYEAKKNVGECDSEAADVTVNAEQTIVLNFSSSLISVFNDGLSVDIWEYKNGYDRLVHVSFETMRHEVDMNKYQPHSVAPRLHVGDYSSKSRCVWQPKPCPHTSGSRSEIGMYPAKNSLPQTSPLQPQALREDWLAM